MASSSSDKNDDKGMIRILALHGSGSQGIELERCLMDLSELAFFAHGLEWTVDAPNAPHDKEGTNGYCWWTLPPGVRSFEATAYSGMDQSVDIIVQAMKNQPPVDLIVAHSQGAILITALLALKDRLPYHPRLGYILNGGAWPNPYAAQLESFVFDDENEPRILVVTGEQDQINPPPTQAAAQEALAAAGASVITLSHSGGHGVPTQNGLAVEQMVDWIARGDAVPDEQPEGKAPAPEESTSTT